MASIARGKTPNTTPTTSKPDILWLWSGLVDEPQNGGMLDGKRELCVPLESLVQSRAASAYLLFCFHLSTVHITPLFIHQTLSLPTKLNDASIVLDCLYLLILLKYWVLLSYDGPSKSKKPASNRSPCQSKSCISQTPSRLCGSNQAAYFNCQLSFCPFQTMVRNLGCT